MKWNKFLKGLSHMQVGFIGIGVMGRPMTLNLLKAKHNVTVFARDLEKPGVQEIINAGG